MHPTNTLQSD